jgi:hypothetical protein
MLYTLYPVAYSKACFTRGALMNSDALPRKAMLGIFFGQWAYWCTLAMSVWSYRHIPLGAVRTTLTLAPVLPAVLIVAIAYWMYQACDEFIRRRILSCLVLTAAIVAFGTLGYFLLELFGFPRLSMMVVNLFGWSVFNLLMIYVIIRSR